MEYMPTWPSSWSLWIGCAFVQYLPSYWTQNLLAQTLLHPVVLEWSDINTPTKTVKKILKFQARVLPPAWPICGCYWYWSRIPQSCNQAAAKPSTTNISYAHINSNCWRLEVTKSLVGEKNRILVVYILYQQKMSVSMRPHLTSTETWMFIYAQLNQITILSMNAETQLNNQTTQNWWLERIV
jgi:hypothetical protein